MFLHNPQLVKAPDLYDNAPPFGTEAVMRLKSFEFSYPVALFGLALTSLFWAGNALTARYISADLSPLALSFWRWCLLGPVDTK